MSGGALVAIIAAAHARRLQEITDAFRAAGATGPATARSLDALGLGDAREVGELADAGVLRATAGGRWYLDERAVAARRAAERRSARRVARVLLVAALALAVLAGLLVMRAQRAAEDGPAPTLEQ